MGKTVMRFIFSGYFIIFFIALVVAFSGYFTLSGMSAKNLWIDQLLHFSGGLWAALFFIYIFRHYPELRKFSSFFENRIVALIFVLSFTSLIGVLWEFNEFIFDNIGNLADTIEDLALDLFGGLIAYVVGIFWKPNS